MTSIVDALKYYDYDSSFNQRKNYYGKLGGSGTYTGNSTQNQWMLSRFRNIMGYKNGGIIGNLRTIAKGNGDDSLAINTFEKGEGIIPLNMMPEWKTLVSTLPTLNNLISGQGIGSSPVYNFQGIEIVLPNVTNYEEFVSALISDQNFNRAILTKVNSSLTGKNNLGNMRFK